MATCPICKSVAEEIEPGFFDGKTFRCPKHNEFEVTDTVLYTRTNADSAKWEVPLSRAKDKAPAGARPRINDYCF